MKKEVVVKKSSGKCDCFRYTPMMHSSWLVNPCAWTEILPLCFPIRKHIEEANFHRIVSGDKCHCTKMKFSIKDLVTFIEEILNRKLHFLCNVYFSNLNSILAYKVLVFAIVRTIAKHFQGFSLIWNTIRSSSSSMKSRNTTNKSENYAWENSSVIR